MKKFMILALALVATFMFVVPAMAVDVDFSGHYRLRGFYEDQVELDEDAGEADARFDHRFRIRPVFTITDNIKLTTRFDGHDNRTWGTTTGPTDEDFGLERLYADINFDTVSLRVGRMFAGACGITYCNNETDADRIKVILNDVDPYYLDFTYTKKVEDDYYNDTSDQDYDQYHLHGFYTSETMRAGLLFGFLNDKTNSATGNAAGFDRAVWHINPYAEGTSGPISYLAEMEWMTGDYTDYSNSADGEDMDMDTMRWILDVAFNAGPGSVGAGWAHSGGQEWDEDDRTRADGGGNDWQPFLILTHFSANTNLGGVGNLNSWRNDTAIPDGSGDTWTVGDLGFDIYYLYGNYQAMEKLTLSAILGWAYADTTDVTEAAEDADLDDQLGWELDLTAKYQVMDNLAYDIKFGYFNPGDFYDDIDLDDKTWSVMHSLVVTF